MHPYNAMKTDEEVFQRRHTYRVARKASPRALLELDLTTTTTSSVEVIDDKPELTLMEEVLLLGLKDKEGYTSFWNDTLSYGLRACILVELSLRRRLKLEEASARRRSVVTRKAVVVSDVLTGDTLTDEALKLIKSQIPPETVPAWLDYLSGETWNPFKYRYQMKNVRERLAKNLVEKGVLTTSKRNFLIFDMTTHPVVEADVKRAVITKVQDALLKEWSGDPLRMERRTLALLVLAHFSEVLDAALTELSDDSYDTALARLAEIKRVDFARLATLIDGLEVMWATLAVICR